ncbi:MAG: response regulator transcription factor [Bacteroidales bacterium]|nr:response regulator transcription factor [Bacteroidales bacterium]
MAGAATTHDLLIIDDDKELGEMLSEYLAPEDFVATVVTRGDSGAEEALAGGYDAVILDVMLPGLNGFDVLKKIRAESLVPVIMLTAKGDDVDRILGLEIGADDYLPKPFNPRELVARLRAILRRQPVEEEADEQEMIQCHRLRLWPGARRAVLDATDLDLTSTQFNVLALLARQAGRVVSKEQLYKSALGRPLTPYDRSLDMHISHLRRKLAAVDDSLAIHTVRGIGYQLEN